MRSVRVSHFRQCWVSWPWLLTDIIWHIYLARLKSAQKRSSREQKRVVLSERNEYKRSELKPAIIVGKLVSLVGFWASEVEFVNNFKLTEDMFCLLFWKNIQSRPNHFERGYVYYQTDTCEIAVMHNSISCILLVVLFLCLSGFRPGKICQA